LGYRDRVRDDSKDRDSSRDRSMDKQGSMVPWMDSISSRDSGRCRDARVGRRDRGRGMVTTLNKICIAGSKKNAIIPKHVNLSISIRVLSREPNTRINNKISAN
jgi:hypothetical protein